MRFSAPRPHIRNWEVPTSKEEGREGDGKGKDDLHPTLFLGPEQQCTLCCADQPPLIDNRTICCPSCCHLLDWVSGSHCSTLTDKFPEDDTANRLRVQANAEHKHRPFTAWNTVTVKHGRRPIAQLLRKVAVSERVSNKKTDHKVIAYRC